MAGSVVPSESVRVGTVTMDSNLGGRSAARESAPGRQGGQRRPTQRRCRPGMGTSRRRRARARPNPRKDTPMEYTRLGQSGLQVSRIALGCMSFGDSDRGNHAWSLGETESEPLFRQAIELGITFWDTANVYSAGSSEEIVGRAIKTYTRREDVVLATKVHGRMHAGPGGAGLSRKAILEKLDASLSR